MSNQKSVPHLEIINGTVVPVNETALQIATQNMGFALPHSYCSFVQKYGNGLTCGLFIFYVPKPLVCECSHYLEYRSKELMSELVTAVHQGWVSYPPDGSSALLLRLVPFGYTENADILCWDPNDRSSGDEYWIYIVECRKAAVRKVAENLFELISKAVKPGIGGIFGDNDYQLEPTFHPYHEV